MIGIEKLYPIEFVEVENILNPKPLENRYIEINNPLHSSKCHSGTIEKIREMKVEEQILVWCKCMKCGNEGFMDVYKDFDFDGN
jgi:hypothetical protein